MSLCLQGQWTEQSTINSQDRSTRSLHLQELAVKGVDIPPVCGRHCLRGHTTALRDHTKAEELLEERSDDQCCWSQKCGFALEACVAEAGW